MESFWKGGGKRKNKPERHQRNKLPKKGVQKLEYRGTQRGVNISHDKRGGKGLVQRRTGRCEGRERWERRRNGNCSPCARRKITRKFDPPTRREERHGENRVGRNPIHLVKRDCKRAQLNEKRTGDENRRGPGERQVGPLGPSSTERGQLGATLSRQTGRLSLSAIISMKNRLSKAGSVHKRRKFEQNRMEHLKGQGRELPQNSERRAQPRGRDLGQGRAGPHVSCSNVEKLFRGCRKGKISLIKWRPAAKKIQIEKIHPLHIGWGGEIILREKKKRKGRRKEK